MVGARIEEGDEFTGLGIARGDVGAFKAVAAKARIGQIVERGTAPVLFAQDMIRLMGRQRGLLREPAVFAAAPRSLRDCPPEGRRQRGHAYSAVGSEP